MSDPRGDNEARYDRMAASYERFIRLASFGGIPRMHAALAAALEVSEGGTVLEVGCGPGNVTRHLRSALAAGVRIAGIDLSGEMIDLARRRAEREGWKNVEYWKADATLWQPSGPLDAVVFSLVLSGLPDPLRCVDRARSWLRPGGQLVVLDSFLRPGHFYNNWLIRMKAPRVGAVPEELPLKDLLERLEGATTTAHLLGAYLLVSGRPASGRVGAAEA
jgi:ubiquinone/menaquinone biosynthesis C-methylase UbiE